MELHKNSCRVTIQGIGKGILFNNPASMGISGKKGKKDYPSPEEQAEKSCYWLSDKSSLGFPSENMRCGLIRAASGWKCPPPNRKISLSPIVAGDISIEEDIIPFGTVSFDVDARRVVVQRQGVIRGRALLKEWRLSFVLRWEGQYLGEDFDKEILPDLFERLGKTIGIGDYRPEHKGPFGRFEVISIAR